MCLITEQKEPFITDQDMIVYKVVRESAYDNLVFPAFYPSRNFKYDADVLNVTKIESAYEDSFISFFDNMVGLHLSKKYNLDPSDPGRLEDLAKKGIINIIGQGYHFAIERKRLVVNDKTYNIERFIVPAGSDVYFDETGLGVSNQIIFSPEHK